MKVIFSLLLITLTSTQRETYAGFLSSICQFFDGKNCQISKNEPATAIAVLDSSDVKGTVIFTQTSCSGPVTIQISLAGLTAGEHGFHVHEKGDISGGCATMKSHYNPDEHNHGAQTDKIRHIGDLGNIVANADGTCSMTILDDRITLSGQQSIIGRGLVVHKDRDDLGKGGVTDSLTTGNAGGRIACGIIGYK